MNDDRFDELLPWYVNGTLDDEERAWVDRYLVEHPDARAELAWYQSLQKRMRDNAPAVPATIGLAKVMTLIQGDRPTWAERVGGFFAAIFDGVGMRPTAALAALAVVAVQGGVIFNLLGDARLAEEEAAEVRATRATPVTEGPLLKLNFAPDAKEADIRFLLISVQGTLVGGPGQLGDYYVRVPAGREAASAEKLKSNLLLQSVVLAPGLPPTQ
jgi:anti-sigma factor RsiW